MLTHFDIDQVIVRNWKGKFIAIQKIFLQTDFCTD